MALVPLLAVASLATTAIGAVSTGMASQASGNYQAQVARNNVIIAEQNARFELEKGNVQAENQNYKTRALLGTQKAAQGASGIDVNSGSPLDVRTSAVELGHLDALTILNNASARAAGLRATGSNFTAEAGLDTMKASNAMSSSLIGGASSLSDKWLGYQQRGTFS